MAKQCLPGPVMTNDNGLKILNLLSYDYFTTVGLGCAGATRGAAERTCDTVTVALTADSFTFLMLTDYVCYLRPLT